MKFANPVPSKNYQPHIDGLRALAIIPVFLYHLNASYCSGGFGGVDVFFVISGYLISLGIFKNLDRGTFSLLDFYDKRIRRIIPIYTFTILAVLLSAPFLLYPEKLYYLAKVAISATFFSANIGLYSSQTYWSIGSMPSPLTNLWSLGVEEQFYVILPLILIFSYKFFKKYVLLLLSIVFLISFSLILYHFTEKTFEKEAFFLLPFRMYELLMGSFLAYYTLRRKSDTPKTRSFALNSFSFLALVMLVVVYFSLNSNYIFPGLWALLLCSISVILIQFGNTGITGRILSSVPLVFIGRISYSVYLIHFPVLIFCKYIRYDSLTITEEILITLAIFITSTITWAYIELPIRLSKTWNRKKSYILFVFTSLLILSVSAIYYITGGFTKYINVNPYPDLSKVPSKIIHIEKEDSYIKYFSSPRVLEKYNISDKYKDSYDIPDSFATGKIKIYNLSDSKETPDTLIFGDSHGHALATALDKEFTKRNISSEYIKNKISTSAYAMFEKDKSPSLETILDYLEVNPNIRSLMIISMWTERDILRNLNKRIPFNKNPKYLGLIKFAKELKSRNIEVYFISTVPEPRVHIGEYACKKELFAKPNDCNLGASKEEYDAENYSINSVFNILKDKDIAKIINIEHLFDAGDYYRVEDNNANVLYVDHNHVNHYGADIVVPYLVEEFLKMREKQ